MARSHLFSVKQMTVEEPVVNLTPLIDVVFVILIMFIVITPLLETDRIELANGPTVTMAATSIQETSPVTIHVYANNQLAFNTHRVTLEQLAQELKAAKMNHPHIRPQIFHDRQAHFGTYQAVKNIVEEAGFAQLDIILKPSN